MPLGHHAAGAVVKNVLVRIAQGGRQRVWLAGGVCLPLPVSAKPFFQPMHGRANDDVACINCIHHAQAQPIAILCNHQYLRTCAQQVYAFCVEVLIE